MTPVTLAVQRETLDAAALERVDAAIAASPSVSPVSADAQVLLVGGEADAVKAAGEGAIVLTAVAGADRSTTSALLAAGAAGVLLVDELDATLAAAVHAVAAGLVVVPGAAREAMRRPLLSSREKQILSLLVMGLSNGEIGRRLYITESTVKYHLFSVYAKLGVKTRKEAADLVLDPSAGLGVGILALTDAPDDEDGYSEPSVG
jgi:DNA-binding NarL/FixJ family response regulator